MLLWLQELLPEWICIISSELFHRFCQVSLIGSALTQLFDLLSPLSFFIDYNFNDFFKLLRDVHVGVLFHFIHELVEVAHDVVLEVLELLELSVYFIQTRGSMRLFSIEQGLNFRSFLTLLM